jgi:hypothetical protein
VDRLSMSIHLAFHLLRVEGGPTGKALPFLALPPPGIGLTHLKASIDWEGMPTQDHRCVSCACSLSGSVAGGWQAKSRQT